MFDKTDYDNYCKSYITNMDSNEGLRANLYLFSKIFGRCIRFPTSGSRTRSSVFPPRFGVLSRVGWSGTRSVAETVVSPTA
jgi:hypothetical protein